MAIQQIPGPGAKSVYTDGMEGKYFKDEFHTRISFNRRGLVACANQSKPNTNGSQFFITLAACRHLDGKHTIFGKVVGPTMFNVLQMENLEIGEDDRPVYPPKILSTKIRETRLKGKSSLESAMEIRRMVLTKKISLKVLEKKKACKEPGPVVIW